MKITLSCWFAACLASSAGTLTFDETTREIEAGVDAKTVTADFKFKNESAETVSIDRYDAACTCLDAQIKGGKLVYQPGENGVIRASFDLSNFSGTVDKSLAVWLKGDPQSKPSITLTTRVKIPVLIEVDPKTLVWDLGDEPEPKTVTLTMKHTEPIRISSVSGADGRFLHELKTLEEGKKYEVIVTPASTEQVGMGVLHIETDSAIARYRSQRIFMVVRKPLPEPRQTAVNP